MKYLIFIGVLFGMLHAQELTPDQIVATHSYNHKPSVELKQRRLLQKMANLNKEEAHALAVKLCKSKVALSKLTRHGKRLFYAIRTHTCSLKIDALDGSVLSRKPLP